MENSELEFVYFCKKRGFRMKFTPFRRNWTLNLRKNDILRYVIFLCKGGIENEEFCKKMGTCDR